MSGSTPADIPEMRSTSRMRVMRGLRDWIEQGKLVDGDLLPAERTLAIQLKASRPTVRSVLQQLEREGLIRPAKGRGRIVVTRDSAQLGALSDTVAMLVDPPPRGMEGVQKQTGWFRFVQVGATEALRGAGLHALLLQPDVLDLPGLTRLITGRPRGAILLQHVAASEEGRQLLAALRDAKIPLVIYGYRHEQPDVDLVASDHAQGAYDLTRWLIDQGRQRILRFWTIPEGGRSRPKWFIARDAGYQRAMTEAGLEIIDAVDQHHVSLTGQEPREIFDHYVRVTAGYLAEHLTGPRAVDAILAASDGTAFVLAAACRLFGKEPGRDVLITGYDNYWVDCRERQWEPCMPAATVDKQNLRLGEELVKLLMARLNGELPPEPQERLIPPKLMVITSTKNKVE